MVMYCEDLMVAHTQNFSRYASEKREGEGVISEHKIHTSCTRSAAAVRGQEELKVFYDRACGIAFRTN